MGEMIYNIYLQYGYIYIYICRDIDIDITVLTNLNYKYIYICSIILYHKYHLSYPGNVYVILFLYIFLEDPQETQKNATRSFSPGPSWLGELLDLVDSKSQIFLGALGT